MGNYFESIPHLHRLHGSGMPLSELVELDILISKISFKLFSNNAVVAKNEQFRKQSRSIVDFSELPILNDHKSIKFTADTSR